MSPLRKAWRIAVGLITTGIPEDLRGPVDPPEDEWPDHGDCCSFG